MASASIGLRLIGGQIRGQVQYRASFLLATTGSFLSTFVEVLAILILFSQFHTLAGWTVAQVALLYGLVAVAWGVVDMIGGGFENLSSLIRRGEFDRGVKRAVAAIGAVSGDEDAFHDEARPSAGWRARSSVTVTSSTWVKSP